jgi:hypothetical protein
MLICIDLLGRVSDHCLLVVGSKLYSNTIPSSTAIDNLRTTDLSQAYQRYVYRTSVLNVGLCSLCGIVCISHVAHSIHVSCVHI